MKRFILCALLCLGLTVNVSALEVPTDTVIQNLNGSQQVVKTYCLSPGEDPQALVEEPFDLEGYHYTFTDIVKEENRKKSSAQHTETVTVETDKKDLSTVLEALEPTLEYSGEDGYTGTLALDHTTIRTEAAGYKKKTSTVTETKTIGPVDRNDMSYVPATAVKNGVTLTLSNVDWQVVGAGEVGGVMMPSAYQAVATYSGKSSYQAATGYVTTADYIGEVTRDTVESVTYRLTYTGEEIPAPPTGTFDGLREALSWGWPYILGAVLALAVFLTLLTLLLRSRRELQALREEEEDEDLDAEKEFDVEEEDDKT